MVDLNKEGGYSEECEEGFVYTDFECISCRRTPKKVLEQVNVTPSNGLVLTFNSTLDNYEFSTFQSVMPKQDLLARERRSGNQLMVDIEYTKDIYGAGRDILTLELTLDKRIFIVGEFNGTVYELHQQIDKNANGFKISDIAGKFGMSSIIATVVSTLAAYFLFGAATEEMWVLVNTV